MLGSLRKFMLFIFVLGILLIAYWICCYHTVFESVRTEKNLLVQPATFKMIDYLESSWNENSITLDHEKNQRKIKSFKHQRSHVIILARARTGSSFLGGIFNAHPDVFFIYEPLLPLWKSWNRSSYSFSSKTKEVVHSFFNCNFTDGSYLKNMSKFTMGRALSRPLVSSPFCNVDYPKAVNFIENLKWQLCVKNIRAHALSNMCRNKKHLVTKILDSRLGKNISWIFHIKSTGSLPVRIIYLVRDPRAMFFSQYKLGWIAPFGQRRNSLKNGLADKKVKKICNSIKSRLDFTKFTDGMLLLRYEDLVTNPKVIVEQLFRSLDLSPSEDVMRWLKRKNHKRNPRRPFSLFRELKTATNSWQKDIPAKLVQIVETQCKDVMDYLGYLRTNDSLSLLRNFNKPLFSKQWRKKLSLTTEKRKGV